MAGYVRLGDMLVNMGYINEEKLEAALAAQKGTGKRLGEVLVDKGFITEQQIIEALQLQLGVEYIDLTGTKIPPEMARILPKNIAKKNSIVPVKVVGGELYLAMTDPLNFRAVEDARNATHKKIVPMITSAASMDYAIIDLYGNEGAERAIEEMKRDFNPTGTSALGTLDVQADDANSAPTIRLVNSVIDRAVSEGASDIHIEPREEDVVVRLRVEGVLRTVLHIPKDAQLSVISRIKVIGGMDVAERRIPQDGRANIRARDTDLDLRISTLPTIYGEKVTIRLLFKHGAFTTMDGIGLLGANLEKYKKLVTQNSSGVVLIAGPTGSGKSSTMYSMINALNSDAVNIVSLEDPVEYNIDGVNQVQINEKTGLTFASGLRSVLRQDPDIISVGEIRDGETAEIAIRTAITGHLVLSTIHTNSSIDTLDRLVDIGVEPYLIASALKGVVSQRLVRTICPYCKESYTPTEEEEDMIGLPENERGKHLFYRGQGCPECYRTGFKGRTAVFEILLLNREISRLVTLLPDHTKLYEAIGRSDFEPMIVNCRRLVLEGKSTAAEVYKAIKSTD